MILDGKTKVLLAKNVATDSGHLAPPSILFVISVPADSDRVAALKYTNHILLGDDPASFNPVDQLEGQQLVGVKAVQVSHKP